MSKNITDSTWIIEVSTGKNSISYVVDAVSMRWTSSILEAKKFSLEEATKIARRYARWAIVSIVQNDNSANVELDRKVF